MTVTRPTRRRLDHHEGVDRPGVDSHKWGDPEATAVGTPRATVPTGDGPRAAGGVSRRRSLVTLLAIVFVDLLGFGIIIPVLPFYVRAFGVSDVFIGLLAASYSLAQFLAAPTLGRWSDDRGRRPVLMLSLVGSTIAWLVFGFGGTTGETLGAGAGLAVLFVARTLAGAMGGNIATAQAYIADVTPVEDRAAALGLVGAAFGLGFVFGPALGAAVTTDAAVGAARAVLPAVVPATVFSLPSFLAATLSAVAFVGAALFLPEPDRGPAGKSAGPMDATAPEPVNETSPDSQTDTRSKSQTDTRSKSQTDTRSETTAGGDTRAGASAGGDPATAEFDGAGATPARPGGTIAAMRTALADQQLRPLVGVFLVVSIAFSGVQVAFVPFVADVYGLDTAGAGALLTYIGVLGVINQGVLVRVLSRRLADSVLAVVGAVGLTAALAGLPFAPPLGRGLFGGGSPFAALADAVGGPELLALLVVLAVLSVGNSLLNVGTASMVSSAATEETQGIAFGVTQGAGSLGRTVGPPLMTAIYVVSVPGPFLLGAVLTVGITVALALRLRRSVA